MNRIQEFRKDTVNGFHRAFVQDQPAINRESVISREVEVVQAVTV